jgi:hypothetical protein
MLKALPASVTKEMYDKMVRLWHEGVTPAFWKNSFLRLIPKKLKIHHLRTYAH